MDNKVTKKRINDHLEYDWFKYIIIFLVAIFAFYFIFNQINANRDYEQIDVFLSTYDPAGTDKSSSFGADTILDSKDEGKMNRAIYGEPYIREINLNLVSPLDKDYGTRLQTNGYISSDILILGERFIKNMGDSYVPLEQSILDMILPQGKNIELYTAENGTVPTAVRIDNLPSVKDFLDFVPPEGSIKDDMKEEEKPDTKFYLVINPKSMNIGKYGKKTDPKNNQTFFVVKNMLQIMA